MFFFSVILGNDPYLQLNNFKVVHYFFFKKQKTIELTCITGVYFTIVFYPTYNAVNATTQPGSWPPQVAHLQHTVKCPDYKYGWSSPPTSATTSTPSIKAWSRTSVRSVILPCHRCEIKKYTVFYVNKLGLKNCHFCV